MDFKYFLREIFKLLKSDEALIKKIVFFTAGIGILELTIPFSVQVIINRIYKTYMFQPLLAILIIAFICLTLYCILLFIRFVLVEYVQRSIFAKVSDSILNYLRDKDESVYSLKFFEVVSLKKFIAKFLTGGISFLLSLVLGLIILFFYHPFFASLALFIALTYFLMLYYYHNRSARSSVDESKAKYKIADRINHLYSRGEEPTQDEIHKLNINYLTKRNTHFIFLRKHYLIILFLFVIAHLILLGVGGTLVLGGELTIGQLVASELIFSTILIGLSKSIDYIETYYDCYASLEKLSFIKNYKKIETGLIGKSHYNKYFVALKASLIILPLCLIFIPWVQTSEGYGQLTTLKPNERVQDISALVYGRIGRWYVREGEFVKEGSPIVEIVDNDPDYVKRLETDKDAAVKKYEAAKMAAETAILDYNRQADLYKQGLTSRVKFEKAKIDYHKYIASEAEAASSLAKKEIAFSRQQRQIITAPTNGHVQQLYSGNSASMIKKGTKLAVFVPETTTPAVEIFIDGNDVPLVHAGRKVRLEFEGFPALQFSGWPGISFGTFFGEVVSVDYTSYKNGKFRVLVAPSPGAEWPSEKILRRGASVRGWILMNSVSLGYEVWRQFNGFPPLPDEVAIEKAKESKK